MNDEILKVLNECKDQLKRIQVGQGRLPIVDYPKTKCVYEREKVGKKYLVKDQYLEGMDWLTDEGVRAVDKLHGTNICVIVHHGKVVCIDNRQTRLISSPEITTSLAKMPATAVEGVVNSISRGWFKNVISGRYYGELIGPKINGNLHQVDRPYFIPFSYLKENCHWHSWIQNKYPKDFATIEDWFKELPSLFSQKMGKDVLAEGLVFHHPDGRVAKLRRDMYEWYKK